MWETMITFICKIFILGTWYSVVSPVLARMLYSPHLAADLFHCSNYLNRTHFWSLHNSTSLHGFINSNSSSIYFHELSTLNNLINVLNAYHISPDLDYNNLFKFINSFFWNIKITNKNQYMSGSKKNVNNFSLSCATLTNNKDFFCK